MYIVVDANVLCSGLLARGKTAELLFSPKLKPIAPEKLFNEVEEHKDELIEKSILTEEEFDVLLALYRKHITIIPEEEFKNKLEEANNLLDPHTKDTEYVALAIQYNCPLWSKENRLRNISQIKVLDADEVAKEITF